MKKRVLAIEDDPDILAIIEAVLIEVGFDVIASLNSEPLNSLDLINPDVILLDPFLGSSLGKVLCKELKENPETKHTSVVIISTSSSIRDIACSCKATDIWLKPLILTP